MRNKTQIRIAWVIPAAVMTAFATAGRMIFAAVPNFKPTTAIIILSGIAFGPGVGALTGMLTAVCSNFFFGQGIWTLWQMTAWGVIGALAGMLTKCKFLDNLGKIVAFGLFSAVLYGIIVNTWNVLFYVRPLHFAAIAGSFSAALLFDFAHAASTALFLYILSASWLRKLERIKKKFISLE